MLEPYLGRSEFASHGQRVVEGQRLMQAVSDSCAAGSVRPCGSTVSTAISTSASSGMKRALRRAVTAFAERYADQNERDYQALSLPRTPGGCAFRPDSNGQSRGSHDARDAPARSVRWADQATTTTISRPCAVRLAPLGAPAAEVPSTGIRRLPRKRRRPRSRRSFRIARRLSAASHRPLPARASRFRRPPACWRSSRPFRLSPMRKFRRCRADGAINSAVATSDSDSVAKYAVC